MSPRLLDVCCGGGGASKGDAVAGFDVFGIDIAPQPRYPWPFYRGDALDVLREVVTGAAHYRFGPIDAIHASFPCQLFTAYRRKGRGVGDGYPDLIAEGRALLKATGLPYVVENVAGAPLENPVRLCGSSFGLDVQRHRLFESNVPLMTPPCAHGWQTPRFPAATNRRPMSRRTVEVGVWRIPLDVQRRAMGIDWMTLDEFSQAIPPAYTEHIGRQLMAQIQPQAAAP